MRTYEVFIEPPSDDGEEVPFEVEALTPEKAALRTTQIDPDLEPADGNRYTYYVREKGSSELDEITLSCTISVEFRSV